MAFGVGVFVLFGLCFIEVLYWNVCWLAGFVVLVLKEFFISETEHVCHFLCPKLWFRRPGASILAPLGTILAPWGHLGDLLSSRKDTWGSRVRFLTILVNSGTPFVKSFLAPRANNLVLLASFPCHFWNRFLSRNPDTWSFQNMVFVRKVLQKTVFTEDGILMILESILAFCYWLWDLFWWLLGPWRQAWNSMDFQVYLGHPQILSIRQVGGNLFAYWAPLQQPNSMG